MNDDDESPIDKALGISPMGNYADTIANVVALAKNDSAMEDFGYARANVHEVVENGKDALSKLAIIADQSQNPRAFEVLAKLMDSVVAANKQLLDMQEQIKKISQADRPNDPTARVVNNNLFVGTTAELSNIIKSVRNQPDDQDDIKPDQ